MINSARLGSSSATTSAIGLGCSHIASLSTQPSARDISRLLDMAWDGGIRLFDTADIYGQGDSERRLASVAARDGAVICTKAGLALSQSQNLIRLAKPVLRPLLTRFKPAGQAAAQARARSERHALDPAHLEARLEASLRRLHRDMVDIFLLHSPPLAALEDAQLFDLLERIKQRGLARFVGISCQSCEDAEVILNRHGCDVLQIPLTASDLPQQASLLDNAAKQGVSLIAREVMRNQPSASEALPPLLQDPRVQVTLVGTTNPRHLAENLRIASAGP